MGFIQKLWNGAKNFVSPIWNKGKDIYNKLKGGYQWIKQKVHDAASGGIPLISDLARFAEGSGVFGEIDKYVDKADSIIGFVDEKSTYLDHMINDPNASHVQALKNVGSDIFKSINALNGRITRPALQPGISDMGVKGGSVYDVKPPTQPVQSVQGSGGINSGAPIVPSLPVGGISVRT